MVRDATPCLAYFVHDLADAAVLRRVRMLHAAGARVRVIGFRRHAARVADIDGAPVVDLGRTGDGRLLQRAWAVLRTLAASGTVRAAVADADVVMARNLETLVLAARAAGPRRLVYECLDLHRTLLGGGAAARLLQGLERWLLARVDLIVTSSPRFVEDYFRIRRAVAAPILLVENKLPHGTARDAALRERTPPWTIGWFGMLRCRRSLALLAELAARADGAVEVLVAGIPSDAEFADFAGTVAALPGVTFLGRYGADDLPALYGRVDFAWAIDYFEEGLNSTWLLPNRLYEALGYGAVPIALATVETGAWLRREQVGLVIDRPEDLAARLATLDAPSYRRLQAAVAAVPRDRIELTRADAAAVVATILGEPLRNCLKAR